MVPPVARMVIFLSGALAGVVEAGVVAPPRRALATEAPAPPGVQSVERAPPSGAAVEVLVQDNTHVAPARSGPKMNFMLDLRCSPTPVCLRDWRRRPRHFGRCAIGLPQRLRGRAGAGRSPGS